MKKFITFLALVAATLMLTPTNAEARDRHHRHHHHRSHTYCSGHTSCGCPIYTKRVVRYYDCHGHPVYAYYRQPVRHKCHRHHNYHRGHRSHYRKSYYHHSRRGSSCVSYSSRYGTIRVCR